MSMGAERAEAQPQEGTDWTETEQGSVAEFESAHFHIADEQHETSVGPQILAALLALLALAWVGSLAVGLVQTPPEGLESWARWGAIASTPLILLAILWMLFGRTSRRETERFSREVAELRRESEALQFVLAAVGERLEVNRRFLGEEAARLMSLGDEASDRLGRVTHFLSRESIELERKALALDQAASSARIDLGVLMSDLPRAEEQARSTAEAMKAAGLAAHGQAAALETQLAAVTTRARAADEMLGGAAQRLAAHSAGIETKAIAAADRMNEASAQMQAAVDGALARAAESIDQARTGLDSQGQALLALTEQSRTAFEASGAEASRRLSEHLAEAEERMAALAARMEVQKAASEALLESLGGRLVEIEGQLAGLGRTGDEENRRLSDALGALREVTRSLQEQLALGRESSEQLVASTDAVDAAFQGLAVRLRDEIPPALSAVEQQASQAREALESGLGPVQALHETTTAIGSRLAQSDGLLERQRVALDALLGRVQEGSAAAEAQLRSLEALLDETNASAGRLGQETAGHLVDGLLRVREAAAQAALHAREAITAAIPEGAALLAEASREAVTSAVTEPMQDQIAEIAAAAQRATAVARQASERLTRQLLVIGETAAAIDDRLKEDRGRREQEEAEKLTRRVSLLIEALNSTAIDVNKLLSNDVADTAWAAYLKGDRGVFTRRAVRLLDSGEARAIVRHYEEEADFRDQVNRYVSDFETMLRRVLADRDGATLGVTLLSSDMGKLYVALSQAIERLRR